MKKRKSLTVHEQSTNLQRRHSVQMEEVDDEDGSLPPNVAPSNPSTLLECSDGSDTNEEDVPASESAIEIDDEDDEEAEESAEAELGQFKLLL